MSLNKNKSLKTRLIFQLGSLVVCLNLLAITITIWVLSQSLKKEVEKNLELNANAAVLIVEKELDHFVSEIEKIKGNSDLINSLVDSQASPSFISDMLRRFLFPVSWKGISLLDFEGTHIATEGDPMKFRYDRNKLLRTLHHGRIQIAITQAPSRNGT